MLNRILVLTLAVLTACAGAEITPSAPLTVTEALPPSDISRVEPTSFNCPVSGWVITPAPDDPNADPFGNGPWFINADRTIWMPLHAMNVGDNKLGWLRPAGSTSEVSGRRLDAEAPPIAYHSPGGYFTGFEVGGLTIPTEGCWEVTARAGESTLTFVVEVGPAQTEAARLFVVRPEGERGPLVAYDTAVGHEQFRLPAGLLSAEGKHFVTVRAGRASVYVLDSGRVVSEFESGDWELAGLSANGQNVVFTQLGSATDADGTAKTTTSFKIVSAFVGETLHELHLDGHFEFDAISATGKSLFLIERLSDVSPEQYVIRLYDLSQESLLADPIRSKGSDEIMAGYAWHGVGTPDGEWLLTLYVSTLRNVAFVHALNLRDTFAICIALPSGEGDFERLRQYSLTLSADGKMLYAANTALGAVAEIALRDLTDGGPGVTREAHFAPEETSSERSLPAVLAGDGRLYFAAGGLVWSYVTKTGEVLEPMWMDGEIAGLGANWDGSRLFVARHAAPLMVLDAASGVPIP
jgi:hypothetical protein